MPWQSPTPPRPASRPVSLKPVDRTHRALLESLGQLYRHDLSEAYGHLPNDDGTFNNRPLDHFLTGADPEHRAHLITVAERVGGFVMTEPADDGAMSIDGFFVVRALRRTGVGARRRCRRSPSSRAAGASASSATTRAWRNSGPASPPRWPGTNGRSPTAQPRRSARRTRS
jgi:hypothetical protein